MNGASRCGWPFKSGLARARAHLIGEQRCSVTVSYLRARRSAPLARYKALAEEESTLLSNAEEQDGGGAGFNPLTPFSYKLFPTKTLSFMRRERADIRVSQVG